MTNEDLLTDNVLMFEEVDNQERLANIKNLEANTRKIELENEKLEMDLNDLKASADEARKFPFFGDVEPANVARCIQTLDMWSRRNPGADIQITFSTYGGNVIAGLALFDFIGELRSRGHRVTTKALSIAASMGAILLQAGDERIATRNTLIMLHEGSAQFAGTRGEIEDAGKMMDKLQDKFKAIIVNRSGMTARKYTLLTKRKDSWLDANEALALGLIDKIEG